MTPILIATSAGLLLLAGCSSSPSQPPSSACDQESLEITIETFLHESQSHLDTFDSLQCSGEWALVQATLTDDAAAKVQEPFLFARIGENWVLKAPEVVCGTPTPDNSRPADAELPEDLWEQSCLIE